MVAIPLRHSSIASRRNSKQQFSNSRSNLVRPQGVVDLPFGSSHVVGCFSDEARLQLLLGFVHVSQCLLEMAVVLVVNGCRQGTCQTRFRLAQVVLVVVRGGLGDFVDRVQDMSVGMCSSIGLDFPMRFLQVAQRLVEVVVVGCRRIDAEFQGR
jgi:hypothetical protein